MSSKEISKLLFKSAEPNRLELTYIFCLLNKFQFCPKTVTNDSEQSHGVLAVSLLLGKSFKNKHSSLTHVSEHLIRVTGLFHFKNSTQLTRNMLAASSSFILVRKNSSLVRLWALFISSWIRAATTLAAYCSCCGLSGSMSFLWTNTWLTDHLWWRVIYLHHFAFYPWRKKVPHFNRKVFSIHSLNLPQSFTLQLLGLGPQWHFRSYFCQPRWTWNEKIINNFNGQIKSLYLPTPTWLSHPRKRIEK